MKTNERPFEADLKATLEDLVASGDAERGPIVDGEQTYRLTKKGIERTERMLREHGIDPEAIKAGR